MDGKQTDTGETVSEPLEKNEKQTANAINCQECGRAISQQSGKCYYCGEADQEALKNLKFVMLDWQQEAALDFNGRASESARKNLSALFAITAAITLGIAITGMASAFFPMAAIILLGVMLGILGSVFSLNSLTLLAAAICQAFNMFFFANLAIKFLPKLLIKAGICGFVSSLSFLAVAIITHRIFKNKAIEL